MPRSATAASLSAIGCKSILTFTSSRSSTSKFLVAVSYPEATTWTVSADLGTSAKCALPETAMEVANTLPSLLIRETYVEPVRAVPSVAYTSTSTEVRVSIASDPDGRLGGACLAQHVNGRSADTKRNS